MNWNYQGDFLKAWPARNRSLITNQFCEAIRTFNITDVDKLLHCVEIDAMKRLTDNQQQEAEQRLLEKLSTAEAREFAEHVLKRENLPYEERNRLKAESSRDYQRAYMAAQPATAKQLAYLKSLGCQTLPKDKLEASELIERHLTGGEGEMNDDTRSSSHIEVGGKTA